MVKKLDFKVFFLFIAAVCLFLSSCKEKKGTYIGKEIDKSRLEFAEGRTIGQLCRIVSPQFIPVSGYALVGGLRGTGSSECPPQIRNYLTQYILRYLPDKDINSFINSKDTSVVLVEGLMPTANMKGERFDVRIVVPSGTQTTSLEGGRLYGVELRAAGTFGMTLKSLAYAEGPIYLDKIDGAVNNKIGYVLNGGVVIDDYSIMLSLLEPDYLVANKIRNKLIERFGEGAAKALSPGQLEVKVPNKYVNLKQRFISIVKATYLNLTSEDKKIRIEELISELSSGTNQYQAEIALEAIGKDCIGPLKSLLDSSDSSVRLRAARCLLSMGNDSGFSTLRAISLDERSDLRYEAFETIGLISREGDKSALARRLLSDNDIQIRLAAYQQLRQLDDIAITSEVIAGDFVLDRITISKEAMVFVARSGIPRIALFKGPIYCDKNVFIESLDGNIVINGLPQQNFISIIRHIPGKEELGPISIKCSYELSDIIRTLGSEPVKKSGSGHLGLGVPYYQIIELLKKMTETGAINADFQAGPMPQISLK